MVYRIGDKPRSRRACFIYGTDVEYPSQAWAGRRVAAAGHQKKNGKMSQASVMGSARGVSTVRKLGAMAAVRSS